MQKLFINIIVCNILGKAIFAGNTARLLNFHSTIADSILNALAFVEKIACYCRKLVT